jgi:hypothetical protein
MALRTFQASDGRMWRVWLVRASKPNSRFVKTPEWLAFQTEDESERRRLHQVPANWADLSDERLDLLLRVAEVIDRPPRGRATPTAEPSDPQEPRS